MADLDFTRQFNTALEPQQEQQFLQLLNSSGRANDLYDYDLRGAFKDGLLKGDARGHLPDKYKKPNHPTFSTESVYHNAVMPGGAWAKDSSGKWTFQASPFNLQMHGLDGLQQYFRRVEPDSQLVLPQ
jgi:hypothetical protein